MKTRNMYCIIAIIGAIILKISWHLAIKYHGENTTEKEQFEIAELTFRIFRGSTIAILFCFVLLLISWLWPRIKKNLSNSG